MAKTMTEKPANSDRGSLLPLRLAYYAEVIVALLRLLDPHFFRPAPTTAVVIVIGIVLMVVGLVVRVQAYRALGKCWSLRVQIKEGQPLVRTGPYRFVRHPAYLGMLLVCLGIPIAFRSIWAAVVMAAGMWPAVAYRIRIEERLLEAHFGDEYRAYAQRTARLIPRVF